MSDLNCLIQLGTAPQVHEHLSNHDRSGVPDQCFRGGDRHLRNLSFLPWIDTLGPANDRMAANR